MRLQVSPYGQAVHRETHCVDDIDYEIIIYAAPGGLYGTWECNVCGFTGVNPLMSGTQEDALAMAQENLEIHHRLHHQGAVSE